MKKVEFGAKRPSASQSQNLNDWVEGGKPSDREPTKRFTIDVPLGLHKRVKSQCAINNLVMADVIRELLEQRFPMPREEGKAS
jgi:hypothetical protein